MYPHEYIIKDYGVFVFDATDAWTGNPLKFNPALATLVQSEVVNFVQVKDEKHRIDLELDKPYASLCVLVLANFGDGNYTTAATTMKAVCDDFASDAKGTGYITDQNHYISNGIPMHGWKVFGSLEGQSSSISTAAREALQLKYYKGMSTPLTTVGFRNAEELKYYAGTTPSSGDGYGDVRGSDYLKLRFAMSRLRLRYEPLESAMEKWQVILAEGKLHNYPTMVRMMPPSFCDNYHVTPFENDKVTTLGTVNTTAPIDFYRQKEGKVARKFLKKKANGGSSAVYEFKDSVQVYSLIAYVPEHLTPAANAPEMEFKIKVTRQDDTKVTYDEMTNEYSYNVADDRIVYLHYKRDVVKMYKEDGTTQIGANYPSLYWTDWLTMMTIDPDLKHYDRTDDKEGTTPVLMNTKFNWVRGYTYEWKAVGLEK